MEKKNNKKDVTLNLIQGLPRLSCLLPLRNGVRGRFQIKFGMTPHLMGFTLIELLVVVLIIGILAAVALPQYQKTVWKSRFASLKPLVRAISNAEVSYYLANGTYTTDFDELSLEIPYDRKEGDTYYFGNRHCWHNSSYTYCAYTHKIGYRIILSNHKQCCSSYYDNISAQICKQESGKQTPDADDRYCWRN